MDKQNVKKAVVGRIRDYQIVFGSETGKRVLFDLMKTHFVLRPSIDQNHHVTAYNEGQRNVVLSIMAELEKDPSKVEEAIENNKQLEVNPHNFFKTLEEGKNA